MNYRQARGITDIDPVIEAHDNFDAAIEHAAEDVATLALDLIDAESYRWSQYSYAHYANRSDIRARARQIVVERITDHME